MCKGVLSDYRLVPLRSKTGKAAYQAAGGHYLLGDDAGGVVVKVLAGVERHDYLFEGGVACPFAYSVYGTFYLGSPGLYGGKRIGNGQSQVVVAVNAYGGFAYVPNLFYEILNQPGEFLRYCVSHGVGDVDHGGPGVYYRLYHLAQEFGLCP